jgi:two-component system, NtrC family, nitrogen regulation sensor histidine kinase NtrY
MTTRAKLILYLSIVHAALGVLAALIVRERPLLLIPLEILFVASLAVGIWLVRSLFVPLELARTGAELIAERDFSSHFLPVGQPEVDQLIGVYNTMIDRLREERLRLEEQHLLFQKVVAAAPIAFLACDFEGRIAQVNRGAEVLFGEPEAGLRGMTLAELGHPLGESLARLGDGESEFVAEGGNRYRLLVASFIDRGFPRRFYMIEELTREIEAVERAAYEKLVRMVSHEVNNSVGAVGSLLESSVSFGETMEGEAREEFEHVTSIAIERLRSLGHFTNSLAELVRLPLPAKREEDLTALLGDIVSLVRPEAESRSIRIVFDPGEGRAEGVPMDRNQIERVLLNVLKNAIEAVDRNGSIEVALERPRGARAAISIRDSGPGVPAEAESFTPFFSTKTGGGGLGLMLSREILSQHGFEPTLRNHPQGGAEFIIRIP